MVVEAISLTSAHRTASQSRESIVSAVLSLLMESFCTSFLKESQSTASWFCFPGFFPFALGVLEFPESTILSSCSESALKLKSTGFSPRSARFFATISLSVTSEVLALRLWELNIEFNSDFSDRAIEDFTAFCVDSISSTSTANPSTLNGP
ncbi:hypothetical protein Leryth_008859 [Lithospermum erythrorhizon]|nr:hypothetical protein Leryth_008859 [Lithospermum erythrorhizon]